MESIQKKLQDLFNKKQELTKPEWWDSSEVKVQQRFFYEDDYQSPAITDAYPSKKFETLDNVSQQQSPLLTKNSSVPTGLKRSKTNGLQRSPNPSQNVLYQRSKSTFQNVGLKMTSSQNEIPSYQPYTGPVLNEGDERLKQQMALQQLSLYELPNVPQEPKAPIPKKPIVRDQYKADIRGLKQRQNVEEIVKNTYRAKSLVREEPEKDTQANIDDLHRILARPQVVGYKLQQRVVEENLSQEHMPTELVAYQIFQRALLSPKRQQNLQRQGNVPRISEYQDYKLPKKKSNRPFNGRPLPKGFDMDAQNFDPYKSPLDLGDVNKVYPSVREAALSRNIDELYHWDRQIERQTAIVQQAADQNNYHR